MGDGRPRGPSHRLERALKRIAAGGKTVAQATIGFGIGAGITLLGGVGLLGGGIAKGGQFLLGAGLKLYHGTDIDSAKSLLGGAALDPAKAAARKIDGPAGFYLATDYADATYFAARREPGGVLEYTFSNEAVRALGGLASSPLGPLGFGGSFVGGQVMIGVEIFEVFNRLLEAGQIQIRPAHE